MKTLRNMRHQLVNSIGCNVMYTILKYGYSILFILPCICFSQPRLLYYTSLSPTFKANDIQPWYRKDLDWTLNNKIPQNDNFIVNSMGFSASAGLMYNIKPRIYIQSGLSILFQFYKSFYYGTRWDYNTNKFDSFWQKGNNFETSMLEIPLLLCGTLPTRHGYSWVWKTGITGGTMLGRMFYSPGTLGSFYGFYPQGYRDLLKPDGTPVGEEEYSAIFFDDLQNNSAYISGLLSWGLELPLRNHGRIQVLTDFQRHFNKSMQFGYSFQSSLVIEDKKYQYGQKFRFWRVGITVAYVFSLKKKVKPIQQE